MVDEWKSVSWTSDTDVEMNSDDETTIVPRLDLDRSQVHTERERWVGDLPETSPTFTVNIDVTDCSDEERRRIRKISSYASIDPETLCAVLRRCE